MKQPRSWKDPSIYLTEIHVEESCMELEYTHQILERANLPHRVIPDRSDPEGIEGEYPENLIQGKHHLLLSKNRGHFFKPCPGTREYRCCDYQVLNIGMGCPMDCVYCILQAYLNKPWLTFFVNSDDLLGEMNAAFRAEPDRFFRIGPANLPIQWRWTELPASALSSLNLWPTRARQYLNSRPKVQ